MRQGSLSAIGSGTLLVAGALCVASQSAVAATNACAPLSTSLVSQAVHVAVIKIGSSFDPRGKPGPMFQVTALKSATFAQTCVAQAAGDPLIEVRSTIINSTALKSAISAATADLISTLKSEGLGLTTRKTTVAGQSVDILRAISPHVNTYTLAATKGATRYSMSAEAIQPIDPSAMKSLMAKLLQQP